MDCVYFETVLNDSVSKQVMTQYIFLSLIQGIVIEN